MRLSLKSTGRKRKALIEAFKLCERCEKFYSFEPNPCYPYKRPNGTKCPLFSEVKKEKKDDFLREAYEILLDKPKETQLRPGSKMKQLIDRTRRESKYIKWGWKFCPNCYSTDWEIAYENRVKCKHCGRIFT